MSAGSSKLNLNHVLVLIFFCFAGSLSSDGFATSMNSITDNDRNKIIRSVSAYLKKNKEIKNTKCIESSTARHYKIKSTRLGQNTTRYQRKENKLIKYNRKYQKISKGSCINNHAYTVKRGDTLFHIAWITNNNITDLAYRNNILVPYKLNVGQTLMIGRTFDHSSFVSRKINHIRNTVSRNNIKSVQNGNKVTISNSIISHVTRNQYRRILNRNNFLKKSTVSSSPMSISETNAIRSTVSKTAASIPAISVWRWPTDGKIIENFSSSGRNRGIDIAGNKGQPIIAAASGRIVYAGNALRGYGNLIIIKHNGNYLSAYAHNDVMLVQEKQEVKAGQKIAVMGSTGTDSTRLHFEIRYKGRSVNPLQYLPHR